MPMSKGLWGPGIVGITCKFGRRYLITHSWKAVFKQRVALWLPWDGFSMKMKGGKKAEVITYIILQPNSNSELHKFRGGGGVVKKLIFYNTDRAWENEKNRAQHKLWKPPFERGLHCAWNSLNIAYGWLFPFLRSLLKCQWKIGYFTLGGLLCCSL